MFSMFILFAYIFKSITENIPLDLELAAPGRNRDVWLHKQVMAFHKCFSVCNGTLREYVRYLQGEEGLPF